jgi:hypothetical protein
LLLPLLLPLLLLLPLRLHLRLHISWARGRRRTHGCCWLSIAATAVLPIPCFALVGHQTFTFEGGAVVGQKPFSEISVGQKPISGQARLDTTIHNVEPRRILSIIPHPQC